jgi:hypothetical protein
MYLKKNFYKKKQKILLSDGSILYIKTINFKKIVKFLVKEGADINKTDRWG